MKKKCQLKSAQALILNAKQNGNVRWNSITAKRECWSDKKSSEKFKDENKGNRLVLKYQK